MKKYTDVAPVKKIKINEPFGGFLAEALEMDASHIRLSITMQVFTGEVETSHIESSLKKPFSASVHFI
ncbi:hypothetical protein [Psychrobacillus sp. OK032]|uniref:hypothetical protein n=1 Tax=Psychrobacillus sp. OK032 TaxID=1884358 RepID=UPI0008AC97FD|nr:hypothetical protein [Psychrobacillus sp. OK032]SES24796.1 hypothetical protein SAMN05518872_106157 [Psychrobacillus sp. OK032]